MRNGKPSKLVGRPIKANPITKRQETLYAFLSEAPSIPTHSQPEIIEALIKRIERRSPSQARYLRYLLRALAIMDGLEKLKALHSKGYDRLFRNQGIDSRLMSEFLIGSSVPKKQHIAYVIHLQRDLLAYLLKEENLFAARTGVTQKRWLEEYGEHIFHVLKTIPCMCAYADVVGGHVISISMPLSPNELICRILADLHRSTPKGIKQYLKPLHKHSG